MSNGEDSTSDKHAPTPRTDALAVKGYRQEAGGLRPNVMTEIIEDVAAVRQLERDLAEANALIRALNASSAERSAVPEGWVLVPIEPTEEMLLAIEDGGDVDGEGQTWMEIARIDYAHLLKHVPKPPLASPSSERRNVLEEAAQVCEQMRPVNAGSHVLQVQRNTLDNAARLIRAL